MKNYLSIILMCFLCALLFFSNCSKPTWYLNEKTFILINNNSDTFSLNNVKRAVHFNHIKVISPTIIHYGARRSEGKTTIKLEGIRLLYNDSTSCTIYFGKGYYDDLPEGGNKPGFSDWLNNDIYITDEEKDVLTRKLDKILKPIILEKEHSKDSIIHEGALKVESILKYMEEMEQSEKTFN
jgi:hypothetical protein